MYKELHQEALPVAALCNLKSLLSGADGRNIWKRKDWTSSPQNGFTYEIKAEEAIYG